MSYGDERYDFYAAGSDATASSANDEFFGSYSGLSLLNNDEVVHIQISASVNEFFVGPAAYCGQATGYKIYPSLSTIDLPPMRVGTASLLKVARANGFDAPSAFNASYNFVIWKRAALY
jgi:hypothetical protein